VNLDGASRQTTTEALTGPTDRPRRLHNIEALRGLAALSVAWFHLTNTYPHDLVNGSGRYGWLGVDVFFVISGFVIPYSMHVAGYRVRDFWRFLARRMLRLEPAYLASIALVVVLAFLSALAPGFQGHPFRLDPGQIGAHLFYLVPLTPFGWLQPVYWSLAYEFVFYILCGLLFSVLWARHIALTLGLAAGVAAVQHALIGHWDQHSLLFLFGIAAVRYFAGRDRPLVFGLALCGLALVQLFVGSALSACAALAATALVLAVKAPPWRVLTALGAISYPLYLVHVPIGGRVVNLARRFGGGELRELAISLAALAISLLAAYALARLVDRPATRLAGRITLHTRPRLHA